MTLETPRLLIRRKLLKAKVCLDNPAYMARSQVFNFADNFKAVINNLGAAASVCFSTQRWWQECELAPVSRR